MSQLNAYIAQLQPVEQKVLHIAASHLESSFSLVKSIGFQEWKKNQQVPLALPVPVPVPVKKIKIKLKKLTPTSV
jgi:hypothetical protein